MNYFTEQGSTIQEAVSKARTKYGRDIKIMSQKTILLGGFLGMFKKEGIQIEGYISQDPFKKKPSINLEEEKEKLIQAAGSRSGSALNEIMQAVNDIKTRLDEGSLASDEPHPTITKVEKLLEKNDFSASYIRGTIEKIKGNVSLDDLDNFNLVLKKVRGFIKETIKIFPDTPPLTTPRIFILVGPTGVGKTTTIAKLAAINSLGINTKPLSVRIITIDSFRIGAKKQIETYGEIMSVPVVCAENFDQLRKYIALYSENVDLILVDTIGKSPKDYKHLAEMKEMLDACGTTAEAHLAVSSTTKVSDIHEIMQQFESFKYSSVIITKLDETRCSGNLISALSEKHKPVSYITTGQKVPHDIKYADEDILLENLGELNIVK